MERLRREVENSETCQTWQGGVPLLVFLKKMFYFVTFCKFYCHQSGALFAKFIRNNFVKPFIYKMSPSRIHNLDLIPDEKLL